MEAQTMLGSFISSDLMDPTARKQELLDSCAFLQAELDELSTNFVYHQVS